MVARSYGLSFSFDFSGNPSEAMPGDKFRIERIAFISGKLPDRKFFILLAGDCSACTRLDVELDALRRTTVPAILLFHAFKSGGFASFCSIPRGSLGP